MSPTYREEPIHEPVGGLIARFDRGRIEPLSFHWRRRDYRVARVNASWVDRSISPPTHGFTVTEEGGDVFELAYQEGNPVWRLERIFLQ
ncbi:MAG: hypothetical protein ACE5GW_11480 [Planctomycetota bacterium]